MEIGTANEIAREDSAIDRHLVAHSVLVHGFGAERRIFIDVFPVEFAGFHLKGGRKEGHAEMMEARKKGRKECKMKRWMQEGCDGRK
jgi:hypothetical protein